MSGCWGFFVRPQQIDRESDGGKRGGKREVEIASPSNMWHTLSLCWYIRLFVSDNGSALRSPQTPPFVVSMLVERDSSTAPIVDEHDAAGESLAGITFLHQDIFTIAYDPATPPTYSRAEARSSLRPSLVAIKLLIEIFCIAPLLLLSYFFCAFWESVEPALDIYLSALLLGLVCISPKKAAIFTYMNPDRTWFIERGYV